MTPPLFLACLDIAFGTIPNFTFFISGQAHDCIAYILFIFSKEAKSSKAPEKKQEEQE